MFVHWLWSCDQDLIKQKVKTIDFQTMFFSIDYAQINGFTYIIRTLGPENEDGNVDVGTWKSVHFACAESRKTLLQSSVARVGRGKVSCDVLIETCNILSKIMVILDIYGIKVLTIFTVEYHTTFFEFILKDWACINCFPCFFGLFTFFVSKQCRVRLEK